MKHKKKHIWEKRIPTFIALLTLLISLYATLLLIKNGVIIVGKASPDLEPQNIEISNITDNSFTVSFTTNEKTTGAVSISIENSSKIVYDERDISGSQKDYYSHYVSVAGLSPDTNYEFSIISNGNIILNKKERFTVKTAEVITSSPPEQKPIFGNVRLANGEISDDILVRIEKGKTQLISSLVNGKGQFIIPSNSIRKDTLDSYFEFFPDDILHIKILRQNLISQVKVSFSGAESIPLVILPNSYDFTTRKPQKMPAPIENFEFPKISIKPGEVKIISPEENQSFIDDKPLFKGYAPSNKEVKITIESEIIQTTVKSDNNGIWTFRPSKTLEPGVHTITIETVDGNGILRKITQKFTVFASGSQISELSDSDLLSPAPTEKPTLTPTPTASPVPTIEVTESPAPSATPTPTLAPTTTVTTPTNSSTPTQIPPPTATIPPSGNIASSALLTILSAALIFTGVTLLLIF